MSSRVLRSGRIVPAAPINSPRTRVAEETVDDPMNGTTTEETKVPVNPATPGPEAVPKTSWKEIDRLLGEFNHRTTGISPGKLFFESHTSLLERSRQQEEWADQYKGVYRMVEQVIQRNHEHLFDTVDDTVDEMVHGRKRKGVVSSVKISKRINGEAVLFNDPMLSLMFQADLCCLSLNELKLKYSRFNLNRWVAFAAFGDDGPVPFDPDYAAKLEWILGYPSDPDAGQPADWVPSANEAYRPTVADVMHSIARADPVAFGTLFGHRSNRYQFNPDDGKRIPIWEMFYCANHLPVSKFKYTPEQVMGLRRIIELLDQLGEERQLEEERRAFASSSENQRLIRKISYLDDYAILLTHFCRADADLGIMCILWYHLTPRQQFEFLINGPLCAGYNDLTTFKAKSRILVTYDVRLWGQWFKDHWIGEYQHRSNADVRTESNHYKFLQIILQPELLFDQSLWLYKDVLGPITKAAGHLVGKKTQRGTLAGRFRAGRIPISVTKGPKSVFKLTTLTEEEEEGASEHNTVEDALMTVATGKLFTGSKRSAKPSRPQRPSSVVELMANTDHFYNAVHGSVYFDPRDSHPDLDARLEYPGSVELTPYECCEYWKSKFESLFNRSFIGMERRSKSHDPYGRVEIETAGLAREYWEDAFKASTTSLLHFLTNFPTPDFPPEFLQLNDTPFLADLMRVLILPKFYRQHNPWCGFEPGSSIPALPLTADIDSRDIESVLAPGQASYVESKEAEGIILPGRQAREEEAKIRAQQREAEEEKKRQREFMLQVSMRIGQSGSDNDNLSLNLTPPDKDYVSNVLPSFGTMIETSMNADDQTAVSSSTRQVDWSPVIESQHTI